MNEMLYTYYDDRMEVSITIEYLQISSDDSEFATVANENLKKAFFYGYASDDAEQLLPQKKMYSEICRRYTITREDERYLSLRIYENNYFRGANHPNEWETGITIDMQMGEVLGLRRHFVRKRNLRRSI